MVKMEKVFGIIPAASSSYIFIWIIGVVVFIILVGVIVMFIMLSYQAKNAQFTVSDQGLRISPGLYGRFIPREKIDASGVKVINMDIDSEYKPKWRTNSAGLPGYSSGWFKLANKEKALLFVTDRTRVVYIPTTDNYSVLLSVQETEEFAGILQDWR
jgi:hypothetical protein